MVRTTAWRMADRYSLFSFSHYLPLSGFRMKINKWSIIYFTERKFAFLTSISKQGCIWLVFMADLRRILIIFKDRKPLSTCSCVWRCHRCLRNILRPCTPWISVIQEFHNGVFFVHHSMTSPSTEDWISVGRTNREQLCRHSVRLSLKSMASMYTALPDRMTGRRYQPERYALSQIIGQRTRCATWKKEKNCRLQPWNIDNNKILPGSSAFISHSLVILSARKRKPYSKPKRSGYGNLPKRKIRINYHRCVSGITWFIFVRSSINNTLIILKAENESIFYPSYLYRLLALHLL